MSPEMKRMKHRRAPLNAKGLVVPCACLRGTGAVRGGGYTVTAAARTILVKVVLMIIVGNQKGLFHSRAMIPVIAGPTCDQRAAYMPLIKGPMIGLLSRVA